MSPLTLRASRLATTTASLTSRRTMASMRERMLDLRFKQPAEWTRTPSDFFVPEWLKTESMSHHPFVRDPAPADWRRIVKTRVTNIAIFFPLMTVALGWPYALSSILDGHVK